ncbi:TonB-dependent receptor [Sphingobium sp. AP49]|uniref:TonB-dependent receptor n=1 Tax=Sphingobium sp. AP49 TaxID=1144307 RepID=UPI00026ED76C|nr:TonB-dependent receptor [Sphingobium sp. AP49]WHO38388.1 TonB-dependent receptor [Sphingobium sp. AP49]
MRKSGTTAGARRLALLASTGIFILTCGSAIAQDSAPQGTATDGAISDIIVTAQKRSENAQNVPIAITALDNSQLSAAGVSSTADLKSTVPALNVTTATGGIGLPRIRGIGATGQGPGIENPVAVYVDGVYYGASFGILQSMFDTEQVAVLKGPQGTLFGRNATGGLIQITTMGPSYDLTGKAEIGYDNYDTIHAAGYVSSGITDKIAFSLAGQYENRQSGYGKNLYTGNDVQAGRNWGVRGKLLWEPTEDTKVTLAADANGRNASEPAFRNFDLNALGQNVTQQIIDLGGDPDHDIYSDVDPHMQTRAWGSSLTVEQDFGGASLKSITAYRKSTFDYYFDPDGTTLKRIVIDNSQFDKQFTQELNLVSEAGGPFKWVLGGFYMHGKAGNDPARTTGLFTFGGNGYSDNINYQTLDSFAGFAEGTYSFGASTNLTAGLRYTSDKRELNAYTVSYNGNTKVTTTSPTVEESATFNKLTWRLSLDHRFSPELLAYASYNRGFRSGAYIPQATPIVLLQPDVVDAYEIGIKSDLFDRKVRLNIAGYYYDEQNIQVQQVISGVNSAYNADGAHIYGIDADFTWRVTQNFRLFGGVNYTHARYTGFTNAILSQPFPLPADFTLVKNPATNPTFNQIIAPGQTTPQACQGTLSPLNTTLGGNCLYIGDASGNKLQNTPTFTASVGGSLDIPTGFGKFTLAGNFYHNSGFVGTPDERVKQKAYDTVDASLTWWTKDDHLFIRLWGKNLTDADYHTQIGGTNSGDNGTNAAPRTYGLTAGFDF